MTDNADKYSCNMTVYVNKCKKIASKKQTQETNIIVLSVIVSTIPLHIHYSVAIKYLCYWWKILSKEIYFVYNHNMLVISVRMNVVWL